MKGRPRRVENRVAEEMSKFYKSIDMSPVERIPVLGRTGPDITLNEMRLAIDVKSRKSVPKTIQAGTNEVVYTGEWMGCRLSQIDILAFGRYMKFNPVKPSKMVHDWLEHMDEWSQKNNAISGLVLHITGTSIKNALFVIKQSEEFYAKCNHQSNTGGGTIQPGGLPS